MPRLLESPRHYSILVPFLFFIPSLAQANFRFAAPYTSYEPGGYPISLVSVDLNGDGHIDVATADSDDNTVSIFLGQGDGSLSPRVPFTVGDYPNWVRAGDLDQNGTQDLVVACSNSNQVSILWGAGDGTFPNRTDLTATGTPLTVAVGDLEGSDTYPDIAVGTNSGTIWVFRNTGGVIGAPSSLGIGQTAWAIVIDDMNLDGHNDIVVTGYYEGKVSVFPGTGNANFSPRIITNVRWPRAVITADMNGDAYPDVLAAADTAFVTLLGNGDGTFSSTPPLDYVYTDALTAGDFNRDGKIDVAVNADGLGGYLSVFNGKGDGTYAERKQFDGPGGNELQTADLDEDGRLDLLSVDSNYSGSLHAIRGYGDGTFGLGRSYEMGTAPSELRAGDLNNDGRPDLVIVQQSYSGGFAVRLGELGGFGPKVEYAGFGQHTTAQFADINGDGAQDIILGSNGNTIAVYLGHDDGTFDDPTGYLSWTGPISLAVGDLNQDGYDDLVSGNSNLASVWLGHADGTLEWTEDYPASPPVLLDDFNEDGNLDLVAAEHPWGSWFFPGNGDGTFGEAVESFHYVITTCMGAGDLNEDGHLDLVAAWSGGDVVTLLGDGQGHFQEGEYTYLNTFQIRQVELADLDLDGHVDVCFGNGNAVSVFQGNGDGTLVRAPDLGIGRPLAGVGIADFDQNGAPDIAVSGSPLHQDKGRAVILYNLINAQVAVAPPAEAPRNPMRLLANPARGRLSIQINLTTAEHVRMEVLDLSGRRVAVPMDSMLPGGEHTISWRGESTGGRPAPPGVYLIRMVAGGKARAMKAVWLRN